MAAFCLTATALAQTTVASTPYTPAPTAGTPAAWLESFERRMLTRHGRMLKIPSEADNTTFSHAVFYAPLSVIWILDGETTRVRAAGAMRLGGVTSDLPFVVTEWDDGSRTTFTFPDPLPSMIAISITNHPLARFHDRLLARALTHPIADLPAGSRFERYAGQGGGGIVRLPDAEDPEAITTNPLWHSLGDHIVITQGDGRTTLLHWRELDAALKTKTNEG